MGNYISSESGSTLDADRTNVSSIIRQVITPCCISIPEENPQIKNTYENYTDEIVVDPKYPSDMYLKLAYHSCTSENTPNYGYENLKKLVKVLKIIDGDTIDIALYYDDIKKIFKHRIRLYGLDTPEMHPSSSNPERLKEIEASKKSKEALIQRFQENDNLVIAHFHTFDKYGRLMATLYDKQGEDINKWMIASGYAQEYFGKKKKKFVEKLPLMVSECDNNYFETPQNSGRSEEKKEKTPEEFIEEAKENASNELDICEFEEFPTDITEEAKNNIHIV